MLLAGADERDLTKLAEYRAIGGYDQVPKALAMSWDELSAELQQANLRGRGGAGFPMGRKASLIARDSPKPKYLVVNADESEPGAFKDREVMARVPHRLIEGCLITAHAIESKDVFIYIRGEYLTEYEILAAAVEEARAAGIFGEVEVTVYRGAGAYICGEETALLDSLEGRRRQPRAPLTWGGGSRCGSPREGAAAAAGRRARRSRRSRGSTPRRPRSTTSPRS